MKKVIVNWVDSNILHGWQMDGEVPCELALCESLGYIKEEDDEKIVLAQTKSDFDAYMGVMAIAKGCIRSIKELRIK